MFSRNHSSSRLDFYESDRSQLLPNLALAVVVVLIGVIGGSLGVAVAIGGTIIVQAMQSPPAILALNVAPLTFVAAPIGVVVSLGLYRAVFWRSESRQRNNGLAVQVAAAMQPAGVILDAPYTSMLDLAHLHYPYLPADWLLKDRYETMRYLGKVTSAILIVHGDQDQVIPEAMGRAVFEAANSAKSKAFITVPGAGHLDHDEVSFDKIIAWVEQVRAQTKPSPGRRAM